MLSVLSEIYDQFKEAIAVGVVGAVGYALKKLKTVHTKNESVAEGVQSLLRDRLFQTCNYYILKQGFVEMDDMNNIENLYKSYAKLGGNGVGTELYERCKKLPLVSANEAAHLLEQKNIEQVAKNLQALRDQEAKERANKEKGG